MRGEWERRGEGGGGEGARRGSVGDSVERATTRRGDRTEGAARHATWGTTPMPTATGEDCNGRAGGGQGAARPSGATVARRARGVGGGGGGGAGGADPARADVETARRAPGPAWRSAPALVGGAFFILHFSFPFACLRCLVLGQFWKAQSGPLEGAGEATLQHSGGLLFPLRLCAGGSMVRLQPTAVGRNPAGWASGGRGRSLGHSRLR